VTENHGVRTPRFQELRLGLDAVTEITRELLIEDSDHVRPVTAHLKS